MNLLIREYTNNEEKILIALFNDFQDYLVQLDPIKRLRRQDNFGQAQLQKTLEDIKGKNGKLLLAFEDKNIIGFIVGVIIEQPKEELLGVIESKIGRITELYIDVNYRSKGIGSQLMTEIEVYFKDKMCNAIYVEVFDPNISALNFYSKFGYKDRIHDMIKVF